MLPIIKIKNIIYRFSELENILSNSQLKKEEFVSNSKEYSNLSEIINYAKDYLKILEDLKSTQNILDDKSTDNSVKIIQDNFKNEIDSKKIRLFIV